MKAVTILVLFASILNQETCFSQDVKMTKEVKEIIKLGKDAIIELALGIIEEKISSENFAQIKVVTDGEEIFVSLRNPIKYLPIDTSFYFDVGIQLLEKITSYSSVSNPNTFNKEKKTPFYIGTKETKTNIQFVLESINKSTEVGSVDVESFEEDMIIREHKAYYDVSVVSEFQESSYKVEKESGNVYDTEHAHLEPSPFDNKDTIVFKEIH